MKRPCRHLPPLRAAWALPESRPRYASAAKPPGARSLARSTCARAGACSWSETISDWLIITAFYADCATESEPAGRSGFSWIVTAVTSAQAACVLAEQLGIRLLWLPRQHPKLNPVDHLWRGLKNNPVANRQFTNVDELASYAKDWVGALTPTQTLRKAGLLSPNSWLRRLRKTL